MRLRITIILLYITPLTLLAQDPAGHWQEIFKAPGLVADIMSIVSEGDSVAILGDFRNDDGAKRTERVAVWFDGRWTFLPNPPGDITSTTEVLFYSKIAILDGSVIVASDEGIFRFDDSQWTALPGANVRVPNPGGIAAVSGALYKLPELRRWTGSSWETILPACGLKRSYSDVAFSHYGQVLVSGSFPDCFGRDRLTVALWRNGELNELPKLPGPDGDTRDAFVAFRDTVPVVFQIRDDTSTGRERIVPLVLEDGAWSERSIGIDSAHLVSWQNDRPLLTTVGNRELYVGLPGYPTVFFLGDPNPNHYPCETVMYRLDGVGDDARWTRQTASLQPIARSLARWKDSGAIVAGGFSRGIDGDLQRSIVGLHDSVVEPFARKTEVYNGLDWDRFGDIVGEDDSIWVVGSGLHTGGMDRHSSILLWNGTSWESLDSGVAGVVRSVARYDGNTYIGGSLTMGATSTSVARFDGSSWIAIGEEGLNVVEMKVRNEALYVGGNRPKDIGGKTELRGRVVLWNGNAWEEVVPEWIHQLTEFETVHDTVYVTGKATFGAPFSRFVHGDRESLKGPWGKKPSYEFLHSVTADPFISVLEYRDGWLYVGGRFDSAGGQLVNDIARFDGDKWQPLAGGVGIQYTYKTANTQCHTDIDIVEDIDVIGDYLVVAGQFKGTGDVLDPPQYTTSPGSIALLNLKTMEWSQNTTIRGINGSKVLGLDIHDGRITMAGEFDFVDGVRSHNIATTDRVVTVPSRQNRGYPEADFELLAVNDAIVVNARRHVKASIAVYDPTGRQVGTVFDGVVHRGRTLFKTPSSLDAGMYLVRMTDGIHVTSIAMLVH